MKRRLLSLTVIVVLLAGPAFMAVRGSDAPVEVTWRTASRESAQIAPLPAAAPEAIIQVYAARAWSWRGHLAVHTWVATKEAGAEHYLTHHVMGWNARRGLPVRVSREDLPDRRWYGNLPELLLDIRGDTAESLLPRVLEAVENYPYAGDYTLWPGPNSNTFTAWVGRQVPELGLELPVTAIGKDYLAGGALLGRAPSGSGFQFSLLGAFGITLARQEGLELNLLGLGLGIDFDDPALKLPGIGRIGRPHSVVQGPSAARP